MVPSGVSHVFKEEVLRSRQKNKKTKNTLVFSWEIQCISIGIPEKNPRERFLLNLAKVRFMEFENTGKNFSGGFGEFIFKNAEQDSDKRIPVMSYDFHKL